MDAAPAAAIMKTMNILTSSTQKVTNMTTLTPPRPYFLFSKLNQKKSSVYLASCSTKPDIGSDPETCRSSSLESDSKTNTQQPLTPPQAQAQPLLPPSSPSRSEGLIFDLGAKNTWDCLEIGSPVVKRFESDDEERWFMWYYGRCNKNPNSDSVGLAVSSNGIHWERGNGGVQSSNDVGLVMKCSKDWWAFDTDSIRPSEVVIMSSTKVKGSSAVYWLYYAGYSSNDNENVEFVVDSLGMDLHNAGSVCSEKRENQGISKVLKSLPGLAISQDGRHWARIEGEHHTGALFDVGSQGEWDSLFISSPRVVFHSSGDIRMYYHSFDVKNRKFAIGMARSRDGIRWRKLGKIFEGGSSGSFDELGVVNAHVVRIRKDGKYVMAYEGVAADGMRSIGLAVSIDGLKDWKRVQEEAILKPSMENGWDSRGVGSPCLVQMGNDQDGWRLYYRGVGTEGRMGIGMAVSEESELRNFRRWTGFHL
ncbi:hypothetical protein RJ641_003055 [Dillenia turbinata]|uniref:Arabinanase/levansucrase/invertase n=1 Tax=Dillenia turbinata TaxID=194707 RepID=A0AAN8ZB23_9MAGN